MTWSESGSWQGGNHNGAAAARAGEESAEVEGNEGKNVNCLKGEKNNEGDN